MSNYSALLEMQGWTVLHESVFGDWQGDYAITLKRGDIYAFTVIGYGSCSGCDQYEAAIPYERYDKNDNIINGDEIQDALENLSLLYERTIDIRSDNKQDIIKYIGGEAREGFDWYRHEPTFEAEIETLVRSLQRA